MKELNPQVHSAVGNVCLVFLDEKTGIVEWALGKILYFLNCRTYDRSGDIDPYHHFCSTHLDKCGPSDLVTKYWKKKHEMCFVWKPVELNKSNSSQINLFL